MWRLLLAIGLVAAVQTEPATSQQWNGTAALDLSGGYQTNLYLDPVLGTWNPASAPGFAALTPQVGVTRSGRRTRFDLTVRSRLYPRRQEAPQFTQGHLQFRYELSPDWSLGAIGGATRFRFFTRELGFTTARDNWWVLPSFRWTPTSETMLSLRIGLTQRLERSFDPTDRQTSGLASLRATHWLTDRLQGEGRLYASSGRTSTAESGFGGTGGTLAATYWPASSLSIRAALSAEQLRYESAQSPGTETQEEIGRAELQVEWSAGQAVTVFGRAKGLYASLGQGQARSDVHFSGGVRLQVQRSLGGSPTLPSRRQVCKSSDEGLRIRVPHQGGGQLYVTGDFNGWSRPGVPLTRSEEGIWKTTLDVPSGRYAYRILVVDGGAKRWLDLPPYAETTTDSFGGTNGICTSS